MSIVINEPGMAYISFCLEGFFYGLYSALFSMHLQHHASKKEVDKNTTIIFHFIWVLFVLSTVIFALDVARFTASQIVVTAYPWTNLRLGGLVDRVNFLSLSSNILIGCSDSISQIILIYRCWIVWNRNARVVIIPSILAVSFLAMSILNSIELYQDVYYLAMAPNSITYPDWLRRVFWTTLVLSLTVNTVVTGIILFRIVKVYLEVRPTLSEKELGTTGGSKLRAIIFILIESGMALFAIQLGRLILTVMSEFSGTAGIILDPFIAIQQMLNGITPTIIQVRVSMGLSFHDQESMVGVTSSLHFASDHPNPISETRSINIESQEGIEDIDVELGTDMDIVEG